MKTIVNVSVLVIVSVVAIVVFGMVHNEIKRIEAGKRPIEPDSPPVWIVEGESPSIRTYSHEGHDYLIVSSKLGLGITHSASCGKH
jgi:signal transduction histidine kinase